MGEFIRSFSQNFLEENRYIYILKGLGNTVIISIFAVLIGVALGFLVAIIRSTHDKHGGFRILNVICKIYLTVWRGTPTVVQVMIMYYIILVSVSNKIVVAVVAFGLNYGQTMRLIILPQAFKNVLPALGNEFITLLKETSVSGYIGIMDLTKGADIIRSQTYEAFLPLFGVAAMYLVLVMLLSAGVNRLERRLRSSDR